MILKPDSRIGEIWLDANTIKAPTVKGAVWVAHGITGAMQFADGDDRTVVANMRIPDRMDRAIAPIIGIGWSADGVSPGNCEWQLKYLWTAVEEDTTAPAQGILTKVIAASTIANGMVMTHFTGIKAPSEADVCLHLNLKRLAGGALDTIADTVELLGMCMSFAKKEGM